jgi:hypothetical protein
VVVDPHTGRRAAPWFGSLPALDERLQELTQHVEEHRRQLEMHLRNAEALLAEAP